MRSGLDTASIDPTIRPQDDLFRHTNGRWLDRTEIPADRGRYGTFDVLREQAEEQVRDIITEVAASSPEAGSVAAKVGDLYSSFMDTERIDALGLGPITDDLALAAAARTPQDVVAALGRFARDGFGGLVHAFVNTDDRDSSRYVVYLEQGGIGLPDESYYREERHEGVRAAYRDHIARMLTLAAQPDPQAAADRILALETRLASAHWDKVTNRDPVKTYTLVDPAGLAELTPGLDWSTYLAAMEAPSHTLDAVIARQPSYLTAMATALTEVGMADWRDWLRWQVVHGWAPYLPQAFVEENFDLYGRTLSGVPQIRDRWKRGVTLVEGALGEAVGQLYVERHFPPHAKTAMTDLVANLVTAFGQAFDSLAWMGPDTRAQAHAKLAAFTPKVGYPDTWKDYSALTIEAEDLVGNVRRSARVEGDRNLAKLGSPVDRSEWFMTPQTVNAYYNPGLNEIVFPAAILQPPFFDVDADDAVNYGGIGAVIGHEIGHGFDDQGSQFDGTGNLRNWWTDEDRARFTERASALIAQFDQLEPDDAPGQKVNGALTVGENIGDLCGLAIGLAAYRIAREGAGATDLDGYTPDQRFFLGWAQVWRGKAREAEAKRLVQVDPHAPMDLRARVARNLDAFHEAFATTAEDGMWLEPSQRVAIF
ncbi:MULTISPECIES: M13 family metallopeptidase [Phycicoccus]|uniref:M13 family metallopeptidase n=1 Tax=Phycicoccus TaxID=367298 RepID=UPI002BCD7CD5|nr:MULTISPECIES: M13-type metalloendopeptidase [Phycicoccus]HPF76210.1 M13-type metalloendopeptidase [Phycicoccus elongatus]HPQ74654.1 M13-type metalloendopeptidase [Phycicoccus elongatus]HRV57406.1 M13-type metalloendopeptidase [Phycicoccus sp.]